MFSVVAKSNVRLLSLDQAFFLEQREIIEGLDDFL